MPDICFVLWGMAALVYWMQSRQRWIGIAAGLLLGSAVEHALQRGIAIVAIDRGGALQRSLEAEAQLARFGLGVLAWALPVIALVLFNRIASGHWTGYDSTHESTGFTLAEFKTKWEYTLAELNVDGLVFVLPLGLMGLLLMFARHWRLALVLSLWFVPSLLLYMSYYWGERVAGVAFLRFFLTDYPPIIVAALWLISSAAQGLIGSRPGNSSDTPSGNASGEAPASRYRRIAVPIAVGLFAAACVPSVLTTRFPR